VDVACSQIVADEPAATAALHDADSGEELSPAQYGPIGGMLPFLAGATAMFAVQYSTQALLPEFTREFGISPAIAGLTISAPIFALALGAWVWGPLSDRIGRRRSVVLASALLVIPSALCSIAPTFELLVLARILQGACMPGLLTAGVPYVHDTFVPRIGSRAMGYYLGSLVTGGLIGRVGVGVIAAVVGWRFALALLTVMPALATVVMWRSLPVEPPATGSRPGLSRAALGRVLTNRRLAWLVTGASSVFFGFVAVFSYVDFRLEAPPFSVPPALTSLVFTVWLFGFMGPVAGHFADRHGWERVAGGTLLLVTAGVLVTALPALGFVAIGLAVTAAAAFAAFTAFQLGLAAIARTDRGLASAMYYSVYYMAGAAGGFVPGLAWEIWGWPGVTAMVLASFALSLLALGVIIRSRGR
jgi:YNFM family putative membrane transporter